MTGFLLPPCSLPTSSSPPSACQFLMYLYLHICICICITNIEMSGTPLVKVFQNSDPLGNKLVCKCYFQVDCLAPAWYERGLVTRLDSGTYHCCCCSNPHCLCLCHCHCHCRRDPRIIKDWEVLQVLSF